MNNKESDEDRMLTGSTALIAENDRLKQLLRRATKAMTCCTIIGFGKDFNPDSDFAKGAMYVLEAVNHNIWNDLEAPEGKRDYMWWERQIDPSVEFVNFTTGEKIDYPSNKSEMAK